MVFSSDLNDKTLDLVAERFRVLGDPMRLRLLHVLGQEERTVQELTERTGAHQANVSKHLQLLARSGLVSRRKEGLFVYYKVADPAVFSLCDTVCGSLAARIEGELSALRAAVAAPGPRKSTRRKGSSPLG